jgi:hypothetical protein
MGSAGGAARATQEITERALLCANPELLDETWPAQRGRSHFPSLRAAHRILARGHALEREIARYEEHIQRLLDRSRRGSAVKDRERLPQHPFTRPSDPPRALRRHAPSTPAR